MILIVPRECFAQSCGGLGRHGLFDVFLDPHILTQHGFGNGADWPGADRHGFGAEPRKVSGMEEGPSGHLPCKGGIEDSPSGHLPQDGGMQDGPSDDLPCKWGIDNPGISKAGSFHSLAAVLAHMCSQVTPCVDIHG